MQRVRDESGILYVPSSWQFDDTKTQTQTTSSPERRVHLLWLHARTPWWTSQALVARGLSQSRGTCWSNDSKPRFTVPMVFNPFTPMFMRWLRPLLAFTWMDMLGINLDYGSHRISHSTSKMTLCKSLQDMGIICDKSWGQPGKHVSFQTHFMSNLVNDEFNMLLVLDEDPKIIHIQINFEHHLWQELGATRKASYAFRHMSCPTLSMTNLTMVLVFDEDFKITHAV